MIESLKMKEKGGASVLLRDGRHLFPVFSWCRQGLDRQLIALITFSIRL